ncbi:carbon catabolite repressor protein 4 homolog 2-like [Dendrobium catenatum]|uniref:carbon catabolite repressor protein 4 homolog 2-like n=1 Tax=Dendrobium catenatum TaxID=906689 RepID=UPI0009F31F66|nr:carbon catabolite repressor protein 4 homolog 2-like [Dendrobium catenatum]
MTDSRSFVPTKSLRTDDNDEGIVEDQISSIPPSIEFNFEEFEDPLSKSSSLPIFDEPVYDVYNDDMFDRILDFNQPTYDCNESKKDAQPELFMNIIHDKVTNSLSLIDNGIDMTKLDHDNHLGTFIHSDTKSLETIAVDDDFRRDRLSHVKKYEVEFNKAAQSLADAVIPTNQKKVALSRVIKDNIALIAVLEDKFSNHVADCLGSRQLLCVANTNVNVPQELTYVKLWQVHTLLKGLEKIAVSADTPMLVCAYFNSVPGSAPHALLAMGKVDQMHSNLAVDPPGILHPASKLNHKLPLVSAYSSFSRMISVGPSLEQHRIKMDSTIYKSNTGWKYPDRFSQPNPPPYGGQPNSFL